MATARTIEQALRNPLPGEPPWGVAQFFDEQGTWTEEAYLALDRNILIEFVDGCLEFPPMPSQTHQWVAGYLYRFLFSAIADEGLGKVWHAPYRVQAAERFREPDVVCVFNRNSAKAGEQFAETADLVVEVVSGDDPDRDWVTKRAEYAEAGIPEYWIADPRDQTLTVFTLDAGATVYREAGRYRSGETAKSVLLDGLTVDVAAAFTQR